jgi:glycerol kinase
LTSTARAVLALDLGTTGVRALAVDRAGRAIARAWRPIGARFPQPGWLEQDPIEWWERGLDALRAVLADARLAARDVAAIGVVAQRASAVAWDRATGRPLAAAIGWQDQRTAGRVRALQKRGIPVNTMASATKLEWLLGSAPGVRGAAAEGRLRLGTPDVWLTDRLTGGAAFATDPSQASCTGLWAADTDGWHPGALALYGLDAAWLPAIAPTSGVVGETPPALFGAPIAIAARAGDQQAATFAQGALAAGDAKLTAGTSAMLEVHTGDEPAAPRNGAYPLALWKLASGATSFCLEGTVVTAGSAVEWLVELGLLARADALDAIAALAPTPDGVVFVPALQGLGTPHLDPLARGALFGVTRGTTAAHVVRAVLEGIAQRCADVCDALALAPGPLRVDGGLARSRAFVEALADLTGRVVLRADESETTGLGAALLAGLATGVWSGPREAVATSAPPTPIEPRLGADRRAVLRAEWARAIERVRSA